jgi:CheY-like chemotaxis protein
VILHHEEAVFADLVPAGLVPGLDGIPRLELLPKARAAPPDVPVIMITAYGDDETRRSALEGGATIDFVTLRDEIETTLGQAE